MSTEPYPIITDPEFLTQVSRVTTIEEVQELNIFEKMEVSMAAYCEKTKIHGVGICALQIGIPIQAAIIRTKNLSLNFFNPHVRAVDKPNIFKGEGCLSFPHQYCNTGRYRVIDVEYVTEANKMERKVYTDFEAVVFQHEIGHMAGKTFLDYKEDFKPETRQSEKQGRNDPCLCGSGKKYKKCCLNSK